MPAVRAMALLWRYPHVSQDSLKTGRGDGNGAFLVCSGGKAGARKLTAEELTNTAMMGSYGCRNRLGWIMLED